LKISLKRFLAGFLILVCPPIAAQAGQQIYLSQSPDLKYRVVVEQVIDRRVDDRIFFRYPLSLVNARDPKHHFEIRDGGSPLVSETEKETFKVNWPSIHFDWSKDSEKFFMQVEVVEGIWNTFFVDVNRGRTVNITADLEQGLSGKADFHDWGCQQPKVEVVSWTQPHLAFLRLTSVCGKEKNEENAKLFYQSDSILFDTKLAKTVTDCMDCKEDKALKKFNKYFLSTLPTPTPVPEDTPTAQ
jgi:hypothetical protein